MLQKFQKEKQILTILKKSMILENFVQSLQKRLQQDYVKGIGNNAIFGVINDKLTTQQQRTQ